MEASLTELQYALDTFYFLVMGAFVMWIAAGFAMLEAGLVWAKNTAEILTKNIALYAVACVMYMLCGYALMYPGDAAVSAWWRRLPSLLGKIDNAVADVIASGGEAYYSGLSDFFFQVVFVGDGDVDRIGRGRRAHEAVGVSRLCRGHDRLHLSHPGLLEMEWWLS